MTELYRLPLFKDYPDDLFLTLTVIYKDDSPQESMEFSVKSEEHNAFLINEILGMRQNAWETLKRLF